MTLNKIVPTQYLIIGGGYWAILSYQESFELSHSEFEKTGQWVTTHCESSSFKRFGVHPK